MMSLLQDAKVNIAAAWIPMFFPFPNYPFLLTFVSTFFQRKTIFYSCNFEIQTGYFFTLHHLIEPPLAYI